MLHSIHRWAMQRRPAGLAAEPRQGVQSADDDPVLRHPRRRMLYVAYAVYADIDATGIRVTAYLPLYPVVRGAPDRARFEFVNGFHDTANGRDRDLHPLAAGGIAVMWSGFFNFLGCCSPRARSPSASSRCCRWN